MHSFEIPSCEGLKEQDFYFMNTLLSTFYFAFENSFAVPLEPVIATKSLIIGIVLHAHRLGCEIFTKSSQKKSFAAVLNVSWSGSHFHIRR